MSEALTRADSGGCLLGHLACLARHCGRPDAAAGNVAALVFLSDLAAHAPRM